MSPLVAGQLLYSRWVSADWACQKRVEVGRRCGEIADPILEFHRGFGYVGVTLGIMTYRKMHVKSQQTSLLGQFRL